MRNRHRILDNCELLLSIAYWESKPVLTGRDF